MPRLHLTGGIHFDGPSDDFGDADLPGNQGRVAFAALVIERRPLSHGELAEIVWDERPPRQWKSTLAPVVSKIRSLITASGLDGTSVLTSSGGAYQLLWPGDIWVDLEQAFRRLDNAEGAIRHCDHPGAARDATVASSVLRRPFLTGIDNNWADRVRHRLADAFYRSSITLAIAWNHLGDHQLAATTAQAAIDLDPLREVGHRLLIQAEHARGDHSAALRAYARCHDILAAELDTSPSPETVQLANIIRSETPRGRGDQLD